ncbi:hypothetical protein roselon_00187 [Roseibacterium elongatum DSM 19469]|uniref:DUF5337 domain-containing protein n=1 Tax=Roseicyclus elongatus DSM 19469 TaxID=1294273 RepID=W8RNC5_9RHOB|nr:DUF5337 domain-containing protein [Roseibacterium elongatum]AHM02644.1 hypothetical protein roselon_00187 [Roseibacterium elongatum DSM 19469]
MPDRPRPDATERERRRVRQVRLAAVVMSLTMVFWMGGQYLGSQLGWAPRFAFLLDLAAIAALVWSLVVTYLVWKARRNDPERP